MKHFFILHVPLFSLFFLTFSFSLIDHALCWTRLKTNASVYGPIIETEHAGNMVSLEYQISVPLEKCCPWLMLTEKSLANIFTLHGCLDINEINLEILYEIESDTLAKLDWKTQQSDSQTCYVYGGHKYTCRGKLQEYFAGYIRGMAFIFYPCFANQSIETAYQLSIYAENDTNIISESGCRILTPESICSKYYSQRFIPNFFGSGSITKANAALSSVSGMMSSNCHQHVKEFVCRIILPECYVNAVVLPCRSMCLEVANSCKQQMRS